MYIPQWFFYVLANYLQTNPLWLTFDCKIFLFNLHQTWLESRDYKCLAGVLIYTETFYREDHIGTMKWVFIVGIIAQARFVLHFSIKRRPLFLFIVSSNDKSLYGTPFYLYYNTLIRDYCWNCTFILSVNVNISLWDKLRSYFRFGAGAAGVEND